MGTEELPGLVKNRAFKVRDYQLNIYKAALTSNTLVVLPTGLGKTMIAALVAAKRLEEYPDEKVVVLAPTRPLVEQHESFFRSFIVADDLRVLTGETDPDLRKWYWNHGQLLFMTPQSLKNDLDEGRYGLESVSLLVFDEAHHAVGDYPYVAIASTYMAEGRHRLIMGLTASPGHTREHLDEVLKNLFIQRVEARSESSPDVAPYVQEITEQRVVVDLPIELKEISRDLESLVASYLNRLSGMGVKFKGSIVPTKYMLSLQDEIRRRIEEGERDPSLLVSFGLLNNAIRVRHARLLLEVEGVSTALRYMKGFDEESSSYPSRSLRQLLKEPIWSSSIDRLEELKRKGVEHPKVPALLKLVEESLVNDEVKVLVFAHYRETTKMLAEMLSGIARARPAPFLGQSKRGDADGMSQKDQLKVLEQFRDGSLNVLVATQVAEEGLDVENCDLVVFYDNVPSAIRLIQRRGRTGRKKPGRVVLLITKGTADETYHWISTKREGTMGRLLASEGKKVELEAFGQPKGALDERNKWETPRSEELPASGVVADKRLVGSELLRQLEQLGIRPELKELGGLYVKIKEAVVRVLNVSDVQRLLLSGSLFEEVIFMKTLGKPVFIVEGQPPVLPTDELGPRGSLLALSLKYGLSFLQSSGPRDTALYLASWASRAD
ncbi:MAG: DEAD/DEAH box helicase [Thermoprotei archaeon]|nr:helicase-related protein [TACK group archaeon]